MLTHFSQLVGSFKIRALYLKEKYFILHSGQQLMFWHQIQAQEETQEGR